MAKIRNFNQSAAFVRQLKPTDATRKDVTEQIRALRANMLLALDQIVRLHSKGRIDKAAFTCAIVADHRAKLGILADKLIELDKLDALQVQPKLATNKIRTERKVKRYKQWSEK